MSKYYRTRIEVEILSEDDPVGDLSLFDIAFEIRDGSCSGKTKVIEETEITPKECAEALIDQDSDPFLFRLTKDGTPIDD